MSEDKSNVHYLFPEKDVPKDNGLSEKDLSFAGLVSDDETHGSPCLKGIATIVGSCIAGAYIGYEIDPSYIGVLEGLVAGLPIGVVVAAGYVSLHSLFGA